MPVPSDVDVGHIVLVIIIVVLVVAKLRTSHKRRFGLTIIIRRDTLDTAETSEKTDTEPQPPPPVEE